MRFRALIMMLCIFWLPAGGGVGPHQITGFLFALQDEDITLKALDDFQTQVRKGSQRLLRRGFFQQRPVRERHSAFKCFAAECVAAIDFLVMFFHDAFVPQGSSLAAWHVHAATQEHDGHCFLW